MCVCVGVWLSSRSEALGVLFLTRALIRTRTRTHHPKNPRTIELHGEAFIGCFLYLLIHFAALLESLGSEAWEACQACQGWLPFIDFRLLPVPFDTFRCRTRKLWF